MDISEQEAILYDSLASPIRLQILRSLARQPLNYSDLMRAVGMTRQNAAGRFAYHLKKLLAAELVKVNEKSKLYELSNRGKKVLENLEVMRDALAGSEMMVRRTESTVEVFDRNKIVGVLMTEAGMPAKLASHIASIAEEKVEGLRVEYLTGSLIRELVNALLMDMGLEKYRHKLTRLGMPLYDLEKLLNKSYDDGYFGHLITTASGSVMREYLLLAVLPRSVGDSHLSGAIDLHAPELWLHGVYAKYYPLSDSPLPTILEESLGIADEIGVFLDEAGRKSLENASHILRHLQSVKLTLLKKKTICLRADVTSETIRHLKSMGADSIIFPASTFEKIDDSHGASICLASGMVSSMGYLYSSSGTIHGNAVLNLPRAYLNAGGDENAFWSEMRKAVEAATTAFHKKLKSISHFWKISDPAHFIIAPCGAVEISKALAGEEKSFRVELAAKLGDWCSRCGRDVMRVLAAGSCSMSAAERLFRLDVSMFGRRMVETIVKSESRNYSIEFFYDVVSEGEYETLVELSKYLTGGLRITLDKSGDWRNILDTLQSSASKDTQTYLILRGLIYGS